MRLHVPRLLAISPPAGSIHPETVLTWKGCELDRFGFAVLIREPHFPLPDALNTRGRLAPLIRGCLETGIPMLLSANFSDLALISQLLLETNSSHRTGLSISLSRQFSLRTTFVGFQFRGDPSHAQLNDIRSRLGSKWLIGTSCHGEVSRSPGVFSQLVDYHCFAPVFSPRTLQAGVSKVAMGIDQLELWCRASRPTPVLALGGISQKNAEVCLDAGAFGLAGIGQFFGSIVEVRHRNLELSEILQRRTPK